MYPERFMATLTADTIENVLQIVSDLRGENTTNTDAKRVRAVSRAERDFAKRQFFRTHRIESTETGTGNNSYTIGSASYPMRSKGLSEVFVGGTTEDKRHGIVDFNAFKALYNNNNSIRVAYEWYDQANDAWKVYINPAPESGVTIYYTYYYEPPKKTSTSDLVVCPNPRILALLALADIYEGEDEGDMALEKKAEAEQLISEVMGVDDAPAVNQTYAFSVQQNSVYSRGIGTY